MATDFFVPNFELRIAHSHLAVKRTTDWENKPLAPDKQYYDASFYFPKTAAAPWECRNYMALMQHLEPLIRETWAGGWPGFNTQGALLFWPLIDCDLTQAVPPQPGRPMPRPVKPDFLEKNPWARGHWRFGASSDYPPQVADPMNNPMQKTADFGSYIGLKDGDYVFASINAYSYLKGTGGASFGFQGVKKTRDGDPVGGGGQSIEQMFGPSQGAPGGYGAPPPLPAGYGALAAPQPQYGAPAAPHPQYGAPAAPHPQYGAPAAPQPAAPTYATPAPPPPGQPVAPPQYGAPAAPGAYPPIGGR